MIHSFVSDIISCVNKLGKKSSFGSQFGRIQSVANWLHWGNRGSVEHVQKEVTHHMTAGEQKRRSILHYWTSSSIPFYSLSSPSPLGDSAHLQAESLCFWCILSLKLSQIWIIVLSVNSLSKSQSYPKIAGLCLPSEPSHIQLLVSQIQLSPIKLLIKVSHHTVRV